ncbi:MAG TPA: AAA family ATPase, partial [Actinomycetota bacterium]|nr:AAA family ATPase [Actinomycetota bacterium]
RLTSQALTSLLELASQSLATLSFDAAAEYAGRAVSIDYLCEPAYRLLMQAHAGRGDRGEGLRAYHRCAEVLRQQIGVEPQSATREVYESLLTNGPAVTDAPVPQSIALPATPLVGRSAELAVAMDAWRSATSDRARLLLVEGEPGIGKTRLGEEVAQLVSGEGHAVARSRAYQAAGGPSWGPVIDWIRSEPVRPTLDRLAPEWLAEIARLLPELRADPAAQPRAEPVSEIARRRLFDALIRALFGGNRPILLVIDDLQWCDRESLEMIGFALRAAPASPCLVLGTVRSEEIDDDHPLSTLRLNLARDGVLTEIPLGRLDSKATLELATIVGGAELDEETAGALWRETEGMPLFVVEAIRTGSKPAGGRTEITPTVKAVITARLAQLSVPARRLAEVAATVGRSFTVEVLAAAEPMEEDDLVEAIDELWRRQIVREQWGAYDFSHDRIREVAYGLIAPARRRRLHASVARALDGDPAVASVVAAHYEEAGLVDDAVRALLVAGRRSVEVFALEDAVVALRRGLALLEQLPVGRRREEMELALRTALGVPLVAREGYGSDSVQDVYQRAMVLCQRLGRQVDPEVLRGLGLASLMSCRFDRAATLAEALLKQAGDDPTAETEGHYLMGVNEFWRGDFQRSVRHLQRAIDSYRPEIGPEHLTRYGQDPKAVCMVRLAITRLWMGDRQEARRLANEALEFASTLNHPTSEGYVRMYTGILAAELEDVEDLDRQVTEGEAIW